MQTFPGTAFLAALILNAAALGGVHAAMTSVQDPATPSTAPFEIVSPPADSARLIAGLGRQAEGVWLDDDVLWLATSNPGGPWKTTGGIPVTLTQVDGTNIWAVGLRWDRWPEAFMKVAFLGDDLPAGPLKYLSWRGERAPTPPAQADPGKTESFQLPGPVPGSERTITVVLPPNHDGDDPLPAIVLADGQSAEAWGRVIAALVLEGKARPLAVVGVHSGTYEGDRGLPYDPQLDVRAREYLEGFDQERFAAHLDWMIETVLPEAARRYAISLRREDLAVAGFSNGGAFAASAALRRGDVFGTALAMSVGVPPEAKPRAEDAPVARFFFAAGELEHRFLNHTQITRDRVHAAGGETMLVQYVAGHDAEMWKLAMSRFVPLMFPSAQADAGAANPD